MLYSFLAAYVAIQLAGGFPLVTFKSCIGPLTVQSYWTVLLVGHSFHWCQLQKSASAPMWMPEHSDVRLWALEGQLGQVSPVQRMEWAGGNGGMAGRTGAGCTCQIKTSFPDLVPDPTSSSWNSPIVFRKGYTAVLQCRVLSRVGPFML